MRRQSRDPNHLPYCSSVCCGVSIKQALQLPRGRSRQLASTSSTRSCERRASAEEFYRDAQEAGIVFIKCKVKDVAADLTVTIDDALLGEEVTLAGLDLMVLATGMVPNATDILNQATRRRPFPSPTSIRRRRLQSRDMPPLPTRRRRLRRGSGPQPAPAGASEPAIPAGPTFRSWPTDSPIQHYICFPYETRRTGIYLCGPVRRPMDMAQAAEDATGAAAQGHPGDRERPAAGARCTRAAEIVFPRIGHESCTKCRRCTVECPFGAIDEDGRGRPVLNVARCRRCGTCMGACPVRTITSTTIHPRW